MATEGTSPGNPDVILTCYFLCGSLFCNLCTKDSHQEIDLHLRVFQELALPGVEDHMISGATF